MLLWVKFSTLNPTLAMSVSMRPAFNTKSALNNRPALTLFISSTNPWTSRLASSWSHCDTAILKRRLE